MDFKFSELIDVDRLQRVFDSLYIATGVAMGIADIDGNILTESTYENLHGLTKTKSIGSSIVHGNKYLEEVLDTIEDNKNISYYEQKNGITTATVPIYIKGEKIALIYMTRFFLFPPNLKYFRKEASSLGISKREYIKAVKEIPIYGDEEIKNHIEFAFRMAGLFGKIACCQLSLMREQKKSKSRYDELMEKHNELLATYQELADLEEELHSKHFKIEHQKGILKDSEDKIRYLAYFDIVTRLPNRQHLTRRISRWLLRAKKENKKGAVFFLDIDNFKVINDTFGHSFGDKVLRELGIKLRPILGKNSIIARFGGDEFIMAIYDIEDKKEVEDIINNVLGIFDNTWIIEGYEIYPSISIGVAIFPDDGESTEILLKNADMAMYEAKEYGKNSYEFYRPAIEKKVVWRMELDRDLRNAINNDGFALVYQPQIDSKSGEVETLEALVRWNHPKKGLISPDRFIPYAEDTGFIIPIGEWVLRAACMQSREWIDKGYNPVCISINISPLQLRRWDFTRLVQETLKEFELDPNYLELEITENSLMESIEENIQALKGLREMGVRIALDDFGTGYSSLNYLQRLPINNIKIDKSFVEDITSDKDKRYIAEVIIGLAHRMNLKVTAEGVETGEQLRILVDKNCDNIQGFIMSQALPPDKVIEFLKQGPVDIGELIGE